MTDLKKSCSLLLVALILCTCVCPAMADTFAPSLDRNITGTLTVAGHYSNFESLIGEFNLFAQYYPNVTMLYRKLDSYNDVIEMALTGDEAPDIFFMYPSMIYNPDYEDLFEIAEDLSEPALGIRLDSVQSEVLYRDANGKVPYVPIFGETYGMLVNESIFADLNLPIPTTYTELIQACDTLKQAGYASPIMGYSANTLLYPMFFPYFCAKVQGDETALAHLNAMDEEAPEYAREALELADGFMKMGYFDLALCDQEITKDYEPLILRFLEGDVPMMLTKSSTVSGTGKREAKSEAFTAHPFPYSFWPVPSTEEGGYFLDVISMGFAVNSLSGNLDIANEFMRFLVCNEELNRIANANRMVPTAQTMTPDTIYSPFSAIYPERIIYQTRLGLDDIPDTQVRKAGERVCRGEMTVDEALAAFGTLN